MPGRRDARRSHRSRRRRLTAVSTWLPALLLVAGVGGSIGLAARLEAIGRERARTEFRGAVRESTEAVGSELRRSEGALRGLRGLFLSSARVHETEFHRYIGSLDLARGYPSIRGIVYVAAVPAGRVGAFAAAERRHGRPGFRIRPAPDSDPALLDTPVHRIVTFADPPGATSSRPGNDVTARRPSRPAQDRSRDTGRVALTAKLDLVPGAPRPQPGFSLLLPMYRAGAPAATVTERRAALRGWIVARFRARDFVRGIRTPAARSLGIALFDGDRPAPGALLARAGIPRPGGRSETVRLDLAGRRWTIRYTELRGFAGRGAEREPIIVLVGGIAVSLLLAALVHVQMAARRRADREVHERTAELRQTALELGRVNGELEVHSREVEAFAQLQHDFVTTASHELRTPLTSILGYLELVLGAGPDELRDEQRGHLQIVYRSGRRLLAIVADLLTIDTVDAGAMEIEPELVSLDTLVAPTLLTFGPACERKRLALHAGGDAGRILVRADRGRMDQVLGNLVGNAVKFTDEGEVRIDVRAAGGHAELRVSDTGAGIPADELPRVFDRFFRASSSHRSATPGTGLGLTIARSLVEAHGGQLSVESVVGRGTTFTIRLPLAGAPDALAAPRA